MAQPFTQVCCMRQCLMIGSTPTLSRISRHGRAYSSRSIEYRLSAWCSYTCQHECQPLSCPTSDSTRYQAATHSLPLQRHRYCGGFDTMSVTYRTCRAKHGLKGQHKCQLKLLRQASGSTAGCAVLCVQQAGMHGDEASSVAWELKGPQRHRHTCYHTFIEYFKSLQKQTECLSFATLSAN